MPPIPVWHFSPNPLRGSRWRPCYALKLYQWKIFKIALYRLDLRVKENKKIFPTVRQTYSQHDAMLDVEENLFLFSVVPDKSMQCVGMRNPAQQTWVCWQRDNCVTLNSENSNQKNAHITAITLLGRKTGRLWCVLHRLCWHKHEPSVKMSQNREPILRISRRFCCSFQLTMGSVTD